jgi:hypothetical protein
MLGWYHSLQRSANHANPRHDLSQPLNAGSKASLSQPLDRASKFFRIRTYANRARNSFTIRTYKFVELKVL